MIYSFSDYQVDTRLYQLRHKGDRVSLQPLAFRMLVYLLEHREHVVSKQELVDNIWGGIAISDSSPERCMTLIRKAIGDNKKERIVETVRTYGYRFAAPVEVLSDISPVTSSAPRSISSLYVFISYSHNDSDIADVIATDLLALGIEYFLDRKDIRWGQSIRQNVREALYRCSHQIIILSPASIKSQWVHFEAGFAMGAGRIALPFLSHPSLDVPEYFGDLLFKTSREDIEEYFRFLVMKDINSRKERL